MDPVTVVKTNGRITDITEGGSVTELTPEMAEFIHDKTMRKLKEFEMRIKALEIAAEAAKIR